MQTRAVHSRRFASQGRSYRNRRFQKGIAPVIAERADVYMPSVTICMSEDSWRRNGALAFQLIVFRHSWQRPCNLGHVVVELFLVRNHVRRKNLSSRLYREVVRNAGVIEQMDARDQLLFKRWMQKRGIGMIGCGIRDGMHAGRT